MSFFDNEEIQDLKKKAEDAAIPKTRAKPGIYKASLKSVQLDRAKSSGDLMIVIEEDIGPEFYPIKLYITFPDDVVKNNKSKEKLFTFCYNAFKFEFSPVLTNDKEEALVEVVKQMEDLVGRDYQLAVRGEQNFYKKTTEGGEEIVETVEPKHFYVGAKDEEMKWNPQNAVRMLSEKEKEAIQNKFKSRSFVEQTDNDNDEDALI